MKLYYIAGYRYLDGSAVYNLNNPLIWDTKEGEEFNLKVFRDWAIDMGVEQFRKRGIVVTAENVELTFISRVY